ncbi:hypothetical protein [Metabacillus sp. 84]|uniref:hypothetical protein n=1 Tax=Metabacillus sp. 84 TaxID=3404705 RepID=UPI003CF822BA
MVIINVDKVQADNKATIFGLFFSFGFSDGESSRDPVLHVTIDAIAAKKRNTFRLLLRSFRKNLEPEKRTLFLTGIPYNRKSFRHPVESIAKACPGLKF